ncbi:hypothetical protein MPDQ_004760 [Monascus purpureus]|uniref:Uncharacterized protein n=1 Tax=Monascus purpureus TaxID=5098 RepID=A0A507R245_MONPU|nr:hypothetical protein MPDQ_004760 [Monascus purpureus]BDD62858.1 hypothetical protein MAP00_007814 [Monascus purpureus]
MPSRLATPVLTVDPAKIQQVDTANTQSLHGMWLVFSKCASYIEEGRRLENLSWRLWTRETFCVEPQSSCDTSVLPLLRSESSDPPELSASVDSAASDQAETIEAHIKRPRFPDYRPSLVRDDSLLNWGKEKHITSSGLERMVLNIKEKKHLEPLSSPPLTTIAPPAITSPKPTTPTASPPSTATESSKTPTCPAAATAQPQRLVESCSTTAPESEAAEVAPSDTSVSSCGVPPSRSGLFKSPSVVRGFSPSQVSSSYRSQPRLAPEPRPAEAATLPKPSPMKMKKGMFTLGGSSGDDDESSFEDRMAVHNNYRKSSLSQELGKSAPRKSITPLKTASFRDQVIKERAGEDEDAIVTDDDISESAIEDDEDSDWEDSVTESGRSSVEDRDLFQRVDSRPNLVSRRSLLTMMMHQPAKMQMQMNPSRSSSALQRARLNGPSVPVSPPEDDDEEEEDSLTMRGPDVPRSKPIIVRPMPTQPVAHSPRTTRRNMLATELTESLRRHLLWERQQKSATANAFLKRRHTAHDVANLNEYPGPGGQNGQAAADAANQAKDKDASKIGSWNNYTDFGPWEYHAKGW